LRSRPRPASAIRERTPPGQRTDTPMFVSARSHRCASERPTTPYFAVVYEAIPGVAPGRRPAMDAVFTKCPASPEASIRGRNASILWMTAVQVAAKDPVPVRLRHVVCEFESDDPRAVADWVGATQLCVGRFGERLDGVSIGNVSLHSEGLHALRARLTSDRPIPPPPPVTTATLPRICSMIWSLASPPLARSRKYPSSTRRLLATSRPCISYRYGFTASERACAPPWW